MSVILQIAPKIWTQGFSGSLKINVTNSGTENVRNVKLKVTDSVVFTSLKVYAEMTWNNCLNVFTNDYLHFYVGDTKYYTLPAGATREGYFNVDIKAGAPVQVHNITCGFQYEVY